MTVFAADEKKLIGKALHDVGFRRSGSRWWRQGSDVSTTVAFFRSLWGPHLYVEIGVETRPGFQGRCAAPEDSAIWFRADQLRAITECRDASTFDELLDFEAEMGEAERTGKLVQAVERVLISGLEKTSQREFLRSAEGQEFLRGALVTIDADL